MFPWIASLALAMTDTLLSNRRAWLNRVCKIEGSELFVNWLANHGPALASSPRRSIGRKLARDTGVS